MPRFQKGQSGNPAGRAKGSRNKLSEDFISDVQESWKENGKEAIQTMKDEDNTQYVKMVASLVPKDYNINVTDETDSMPIDEVRGEIIANLKTLGISAADLGDDGTLGLSPSTQQAH